ncbi:nucleoside hydrolase-like domain-containing protein [Demequina rhizosphaerae]|uniref:nucleoside hydrolase-like domain-containing protein n=1 Tax=Demequina rhizosphaerae TaxID=1638985 RepID=UPI000AD0BF8F|nr:nucleoside hydrolase-like domain-containing protein [Demequina rhizosphaerae]
MTSAGTPGGDRVRVVVTTDPELDDLNSMLRLVLYSNEIELAGLVYSSSMFHWAGDPARGVEPFRWPPAGARGHIDQAIDAYERVHDTLRVHDARYPAPGDLRAVVREGNVSTEGDTRDATPGSDLIADLLADDEPGTLVLQAWGGLNTIARALMSVEERHAGSPGWDALRARIMARTVLTSWGEQDSAFAEYIRPRWPELELRQVATVAWGYGARQVTPPATHRFYSAAWTREHVSRVGPIGAAYRVWGDGLQMADGFDKEDCFGLRGLSREELEDRGYQVFFPVEEPGAFISEGDSSNFALHVANGLRSWQHPTWGGWGGRQVPDAEDPYRWSSDRFSMDFSKPPVDWGDAARWVPAFQNDFAARLLWSVTDDYADANHAPRIEVTTGLDVTATAGERVVVRWRVEDPDGDPVDVFAWQYREAGTCPSAATLTRGDDREVTVRVPADAAPGQTVHVILEATDRGEPPLTAYARIVLTIADETEA